MDKAKRKEQLQQFNKRRHIIGLIVLFIVLLIPFRITFGIYPWIYPEHINQFFFRAISLGIIWFAVKHKHKRDMAILMIIACLALSIYRGNIASKWNGWNCLQSGHVPTYGNGATEWDYVVFEPIWCSPHVLGACCYTEYIKVKYIPIIIYSDWVNMWSPNAGLRQDW